MADNSILTPGYQDPIETPVTSPPQEDCLIKDNFLSEYETEEEKSVVRENLNVPSKDSVYSRQDVDTQVSEKIRATIQEYLNMEDPHGILPTVAEMIADMVKSDGSTPFTAPQTGVDPQTAQHLTTKNYVDKLVREHVNADDPHNILPEVAILLEKYVRITDVYVKSQLYTKQDIDNQAKDYIRKDGSTPFTKAQIGADPQIDSHLATKRYVDKSLYNHQVDVDPHGFLTILNQRLASYAKKKDVYDKTQTYSRTQIDSIIHNLVNETIDASLQSFMDTVNDKFEYIRLQKYVKQDGSVPFRRPQAGVDAVEEEHLTTLRQLNQAVEDLEQNLTEQIQAKECLWKTSGPVESTVGHIDDNTPVPATMSLQEVLDAIFYGKGISISAPDYVTINNKVPITLCVHGSTGLIDVAELYQDGKLTISFVKEDFENGCVTVDSLPIIEDTEFTFKVTYTNEAVHEESITVKAALPIFVGLLPKWKFGNMITWNYLEELASEEPNNNQFINSSNNLNQISINYSFQDAKLRHPFIVVPVSYPDLDNMSTTPQRFGIDAFDVIDMIPLQVPGIEKDIIFKIYIYRQALSSLNQEVTFNFT